MEKSIFEIISDMVFYIFDIKISEIPLHIAYVGVIALCSYCASSFLIGFSCSVWETITKKKVNEEIQSKIIHILAMCLSIMFSLRLLYEFTV